MFARVSSKQEAPNFSKALSVMSKITLRVLRVWHDYQARLAFSFTIPSIQKFQIYRHSQV